VQDDQLQIGQRRWDLRSKVVFAIKLTLSVGLLVYLIRLMDWARFGEILRELDKPLLGCVLLVALFRLGFAAVRWQRILRDYSVGLSWGFAYASYLVGAFYNVFLPGVTGGDVIRAGRCVRRTQCSWGSAVASVILERVGGFVATLVIALAAYLSFPELLASLVKIENPAWVELLAALGIALIVVFTVGRRRWMGWLPTRPLGGVRGFIVSAIRAFGVLQGWTFVQVLVLSVIFQGLDIVVVWLLSQAMGLGVALPVFVVIVPLVYLAIMLPISLGGLGVREGMFTFLLAQFGVGASDAVALSFLVYFLHVILGMAGGITQFTETVTVSRRA